MSLTEPIYKPSNDFIELLNRKATKTDEEIQAEEEAIELENKRKLKEKCFKDLNLFYEYNNYLPDDSIERKLESIKEENPELYTLVKKWDVYGSYGFCVCGPVGTGKTYALTAILNHITFTLADGCYSVRNSIIWKTSSILLEELKESYLENESVLDKIEKIQSIRFLFIDDIGAHKVSEFAIEKLVSILDYRVNNNLPTFFSTNCKIDQMKTTFGERIFSRIIATSVMVEVKGKDRRIDLHAQRLKQLKGEI